MNTEVEVKFAVLEKEKCLQKLKEKSRFIKTKTQIDQYYDHPCKNFLADPKTKEYLRVRTEEKNASLEYHKFFAKGNVKSYTEEFEVKVNNPEKAKEILQGLGFKPKILIEKKRTEFETQSLKISLDEVNGLGCFLEIEAKKADNIEEAEKLCMDFAKELEQGLKKAPKGGYPELFLKGKF